MIERVALYGKKPNQKHYRLLTITLDARVAAGQGRKLQEEGSLYSWFTKRFKLGESVPGRYERMPLQADEKGG